jgi:3-oxoacyl-[acyl-carrier protein] reductase
MRACVTAGSRGIGSRRDGDVGDDPGALVAAREITVNAVAPGPTATEAFKAMGEERLVAATPMVRMGQPQDAARLIAWLCSPEAGWVTGQLIFSDGGYLLG